MSNYTTEVRYICETQAGEVTSKGYNSIDEILTISAPLIFNFNFPIFDENYRVPLEKKILRHYYTREICEETVGLWKLRLEDRLNMIMPYYNKLYETTLLKFNPLYDADLYTVGDKDNNTQANRDQSTTRSGTNVDSRNRFTDEEKDNKIGRNAFEVVDDNRTSKERENAVGDSQADIQNETEENRESHNFREGSGSNDSFGTKIAGRETLQLYSDTPQGGIHGINGTAGGNGSTLGDLYYLTNAQKDTIKENNTDISQSENSSVENNSGNESNATTGTSSTNETFINNTNRESADASNIERSRNEYEGNKFKGETDQSEMGTSNFNELGTHSGNELINNTESYINHVFGKSPGVSYSKLVDEFRKIILNIDRMIINDLSDLFFGLWA